MIIRGIYHAHSRYSNDGHLSFSELRELFQGKGIRFIIMTEHAEDLTPESYKAFYEECMRASDDAFMFIPGLEVPYEGKVHVGCFPGAPTYARVPLFREGIEHMKAHGALAIYHHPSKQAYYMNEDFRALLDGVEIWNSRYEGVVAPSLRTMVFVQKYFNDTLQFCGLDVHSMRQANGPVMRLEVPEFTVEKIMEAFRSHTFVLEGKFFHYNGQNGERLVQKLWYYLVRSLYSGARTARTLLRRIR